MKTLKITTSRFVFLFALLFIVSVPFEYFYIPDITKYTRLFFEYLIKWTGDKIFQIKRPYTFRIISDSTGMYLHVFLLSAISAVITLSMNLLDQEKLKKINLNYWAYTIISYYLSLQLFKYGFDKLFKHQFYLPEPNTAFTTLSQLSPDILYWTTMGSSYSYSVFCGIIEIIPAVLLLFRRTSSLGGIIAALVMVNVVMINFGFDISVKVYACFLLFISGIVAYPGIRKIIDVFIYKNVKDLQQLKPTFHAKKAFPYIITKMFIISYILVESLAVYFRSGSFNDDKAERPYLHGAYNIIDFVKNNDTIPPLLTNKDRFKRIFIHREGYFITQNMNDEMDDYKMNFDFINKKLILKTYDQNEIIIDYLFSEKDSTLTLKGNIENIRVYIKAKQIDLKRLPLFQKSFHWTLDDYLR